MFWKYSIPRASSSIICPDSFLNKLPCQSVVTPSGFPHFVALQPQTLGYFIAILCVKITQLLRILKWKKNDIKIFSKYKSERCGMHWDLVH